MSIAERVAAYLADLWRVLAHALRLDPAAYDAAHHPHPWWALPLGVLVVATVSVGLGRAIVLVLNQVRGWRVAYATLTGVAGLLVAYVTLGVMLSLAGSLLGDHVPALRTLVTSLTLAAAPSAFGFLVLLPYSGPAIERALGLWSLLILWRVVMDGFALDPLAGLGVAAAGWVSYLVVANLLARPLGWLRDRVWRALTGAPLALSAQELLRDFPVLEEAGGLGGRPGSPAGERAR